MAEMRWSLLEIVDRLTRKMNIPRPVSLNAAELVSQPIFEDLIDTIDEVIQDLMLRMWPEEIKATQRILTVARRNLTGVTATLSSASIAANVTYGFASTDVGTTFPNKRVYINGLDRLISLATYASAISATLAETWPIASITGGTGYVCQDTFRLNDDFSRPMTPLDQFITNSKVSYVSPQVFVEQHRNKGSIEFGEPKICTITMDEDGSRCICFNPVPDEVYVFDLNYYKVASTFAVRLTAAPTTANALYCSIPADQQSIIIAAVLREIYGYQQQDPRFQVADSDMREKLGLLAPSNEGRGVLRLAPRMHRSARRLFNGGAASEAFGDTRYLDDLPESW